MRDEDGPKTVTAPFEIVNPAALGEPRGWNHGLLAPPGARTLFVAGQTARDADGAIVGEGIVEQFGAALENVLAVVREAGGGPETVARMTVYVTDLAEYRAGRGPLGEVWRRLMGRHYPAMALVEVSGLVDEGGVVEIEATAVLPPEAGRGSPHESHEGGGGAREPEAPR